MKLIRIVDTRDFDIIEGMYKDKKVPIPGSGNQNRCAMCGSVHEIHAYVENDAGEQMIVGIGCAKKLDGMTTQIKLLQLAEKLEALKAPEAWSATAGKLDYSGRREFDVCLGAFKARVCVSSRQEKDAVMWVARGVVKHRELWKDYFTAYYRIKNQIAKYEAIS